MIFDKNNFSKILPPIMKFTLVLKYLLKALSRIQFWSCSLRKKSATGLRFPKAKVNPSWHEIVIECVTFPWKEDVKNYKRTHICTLLVATGFEISVKCNCMIRAYIAIKVWVIKDRTGSKTGSLKKIHNFRSIIMIFGQND